MLREKIQAEIVTAMKAKDKERIAALRLIGAKIKDRDIELRTSDKKPEDDAMVTDVLLKMAKQRRESIEMYEAGGRQELADKEKAELATIEEFLPKQMSEEETKAAIADIKAETGAEGMKGPHPNRRPAPRPPSPRRARSWRRISIPKASVPRSSARKAPNPKPRSWPMGVRSPGSRASSPAPETRPNASRQRCPKAPSTPMCMKSRWPTT